MNGWQLAFYRFVALENIEQLRGDFFSTLKSLGMRGTVLLAHEGINGGVAGTNEAVEEFQAYLDSRYPGISYKKNAITAMPYKRLLVKLKKEIVTMGVKEMSPPAIEAPRLSPAMLKNWLDEKKDIILLDTRNNYEVELGSFEGAHAIDINHFRHFPEKAKALPKEWADKTVVSFCTGGIRCEKAAPYLRSIGFKDVYQLDGGILRYFEEQGGAHWQGDCFVFDHRTALTPELLPSGAIICQSCHNVVDKKFDGICPRCQKE
jgi:UPF0176 protein